VRVDTKLIKSRHVSDRKAVFARWQCVVAHRPRSITAIDCNSWLRHVTSALVTAVESISSSCQLWQHSGHWFHDNFNNNNNQGRRHNFKSGVQILLRAERAEKCWELYPTYDILGVQQLQRDIRRAYWTESSRNMLATIFLTGHAGL